MPRVPPLRRPGARPGLPAAADVRSIAPMTADELVAAARAWRDEDPDPETRAEVDRLLAGGDQGGAAGSGPDLVGLADRFSTRLEFGTAGLRGEMGAGPN